MPVQQDILGLVHPGGEIRRPPLVGMKFLHQGAVGVADLLLARPRLKAKDFVGLLLGQRGGFAGPRSPRVRITLCCFTPAGKPAVEISFKQP